MTVIERDGDVIVNINIPAGAVREVTPEAVPTPVPLSTLTPVPTLTPVSTSTLVSTATPALLPVALERPIFSLEGFRDWWWLPASILGGAVIIGAALLARGRGGVVERTMREETVSRPRPEEERPRGRGRLANIIPFRRREATREVAKEEKVPEAKAEKLEGEKAELQRQRDELCNVAQSQEIRLRNLEGQIGGQAETITRARLELDRLRRENEALKKKAALPKKGGKKAPPPVKGRKKTGGAKVSVTESKVKTEVKKKPSLGKKETEQKTTTKKTVRKE